ncbi:hypothetical protein BBD42_26935 [Paenibacillus sp. BIHB 4019]|uniref:Uncharacterized protein n=1 Tax=Paenibacillus sp. BIHB 4019 TaxID=1870819 RepID=A0A1B2DPU4_9BACL|nr:hypothetical protein [Paenibacillus sp. BIHB 4019]ANY69719.1 hypothetical protein BBD42_26935 [Paenibacillus sp. BIHB 4019]
MKKEEGLPECIHVDDSSVPEGYHMVEVQGKCGIIEMYFPKAPITEEEREYLYRRWAESALRSYKKMTTI